MGNVKTAENFDETSEFDSALPTKKQNRDSMLERVAQKVLIQNSIGGGNRFFDELIDMNSMYFLGYSDREEYVDLGFFEDRIMLRSDFASADEWFRTTVMADNGEDHQDAEELVQS